MENCQGSSRVYTIKSQYTHHLSLLQMMSPPTPKRKKRFWVLVLWCVWKNKTHTHTQYTHTSCGKKECLLHSIHLMGRKWTKWTLIHNTLVFCLFESCAQGFHFQKLLISFHFISKWFCVYIHALRVSEVDEISCCTIKILFRNTHFRSTHLRWEWMMLTEELLEF